MTKPGKEKSKRPVGTNQVTQKKAEKAERNYVNWTGGAALTAVSTIIALRSTNMDWINVLFIGGGVLWVWVAIKFSIFFGWPWQYLKICQRNWAWWPGASLIVAIFVLWAWCAGSGKSDELGTELLRFRQSEEGRLKKEYIGYAMIAFDGDRRIVWPYSDRFDVDWNNLKVYRKGDKIGVQMSYVYDKHLQVTLKNCGVETQAKAGSKWVGWQFLDVAIQIECLEAGPVGIYAVLGFVKNSEPRRK